MSKTIILHDDGTATVTTNGKTSMPAIVKIWTTKDIAEIAKQYQYHLTPAKTKKLFGILAKTLTETTNDDLDTFLSAFETANIPKIDQTANTLAKMHMKYIECRDCQHYEYDAHYCGHYGEKSSPYCDASDCGHFISNDMIVSLEYKSDDNNRCTLELPVAYTGRFRDISKVCTNKNALELVKIFRNTYLADDIDETYLEIDDKEDPAKWNIVLENN